MILHELADAYKGKFIWNRLKKKYGQGNSSCRYLFFSDDDLEYSALGLLYLDEYIKENKIKQVIPIVKDPEILRSFRVFVQSNTVDPILISSKAMHQLMKFYALVDMSDQWTSISVTEPYDTYARHLLGHHGVTKRELICYDVYQMDEVPEVAIPKSNLKIPESSIIIQYLSKYAL